MIDKICEYLTNKIRKQMPEVDDEKAEIINYGIQLIVGEIPKIFLMFGLGIILGLWWQTLLAFFLLLPYKTVSGGFHMKTHIGCFLCTNLVYCGNAYISTIWNFPSEMSKYITILGVLILGIIMVSIYAPADTENLPILILSLAVAAFVPNTVISNLIIIGTFIQTLSITRIAYIITKNKYGYEEYLKAQKV